MADEPKKDEQEIVGLEEEQNSSSSTPTPPGKIKKLLIPVAIGLAAFMLSITASRFLTGNSGHEPAADSGETAANNVSGESDESFAEDAAPADGNLTSESPGHTSNNVHDEYASKKESVVEAMARMEAEYRLLSQQQETTIDTTDIMAELSFLDYVTEQEDGKQKQTDKAADQPDNSPEKTSSTAMTAQDSVDTLNWLQVEMARLADQEMSISKKRRELDRLEKRVNKAMTKIEQAESARVINLARLYDSMRPEEVAKLFDNLSDDAVMAILPRMKAANAAKILAVMPPKRAARISTKMITVLED